MGPPHHPIAIGPYGFTQISPHRKGMVHMVFQLLPGILKHGTKINAVERLRYRWPFQSCKRGKRWINIHCLCKLFGHTAWLGNPGRTNDQWYMIRLFKIGVFGPDSMVTQVPAMIPPKYDYSVFIQLQSF